MKILIVCELLVGLEWAQKCCSMMGMIVRASAGPLGALVGTKCWTPYGHVLSIFCRYTNSVRTI
jgi:hypothetical protein